MENSNQSDNKNIELKLLSATDDAESADIYCSALQNAIENPKTANIALMGGYGSGKSSIIQTYLKKHNSNGEYNILKVSLANFNFVKTPERSKPILSKIAGKHTSEQEEQISIEISLLQQIIYQSDPKKTKRSRFGRIFEIDESDLTGFTLLACFTLLTNLIVWKKIPVDLMFSAEFVKCLDNFIFKGLAFFSLIISGFFVVRYFLNIILHSKISNISLNAASTAVAVESKNDISILNLYMDELLYSFKKNKFKLVFLEDIDRCESHEIFEKLREINSILRLNGDTRDLDIKFIYAVRDSVFQSETEKNKFFDLIIPIVPYVNNQNSKDKLLLLLKIEEKQSNNKIKEIVQLASLCIDDMRTLVNISNEYLVYNKVTSSNQLPPEKLLALIIYKNLFPVDFEKIHSGGSALQKTFNRRDDLIKLMNTKLLEEINKIQETINKIPSISKNLLLRETNRKKQLEIKLTLVNQMNFSELFEGNELEESDFKKTLGESDNHNFKFEFVKSMLIKEYITPDFKYWISLFHEGFVTTNDRTFIFSIKNNNNLPIDFRIDNVEVVVDELFPDDWKSSSVLNQQIFDYCLKNDNHSKFLFSYFQNEFFVYKNVLPLLDTIFENTKSKKELVQIVFISLDSFVSACIELGLNLDKYLKYAFIYLEAETLELNNSSFELTKYINDHESFLYIFDNNNISNRKLLIRKTIKSLKIKLTNLTVSSKFELFKLFYLENAYEINRNNLEVIFKNYNSNVNLTYSNIVNSDFEEMYLYINSNLKLFVSEVLLDRSVDKWEEEKELALELINSDEIDSKNAELLIQRIVTEKVDFKEVTNQELKLLWPYLVENNWIRSSWVNLLHFYYTLGVVDDNLIKLIDNIEWISNIENSDEITEHDDLFVEFLSLLMKEKVDSKSLTILFDKYVDHLPNQLINEDSTIENLKVAIENYHFSFDISNFNSFKSVHKNELLHLLFLHKYEEDFIELKDTWQFELSSIEFSKIFLDIQFSNEFKLEMLLRHSNLLDNIDSKVAEKCSLVIIELKRFDLTGIIRLIMSKLESEDQISLFLEIYIYNSQHSNNIDTIRYLELFKGALSGVHMADKNIKLVKNLQNLKITECLIFLGLVNKFVIDKENNLIRFKRNKKQI